MIYIWLVFASFIWGINVLVMRYMLVYTSSIFLAALKVLLSLIVIFVIMKIKHVSFKHDQWLLALKVSIVSISLNFIFFMLLYKIKFLLTYNFLKRGVL